MTGANGQKVEILEIGGRKVEVDTEIANLARALNANGFPTKASCCGHGYRPATIALADGRWLVIAKDHNEFRKIEALFPIDINGNRVRRRSKVVEWIRCAIWKARAAIAALTQPKGSPNDA